VSGDLHGVVGVPHSQSPAAGGADTAGDPAGAALSGGQGGPGAGAGHGHGGGPRAVVARGAPAGVPPPSEGIQSTISLTSKLFAAVTITCPGLLWLLP